MAITQKCFIEVFKNALKGNETRFKLVWRVARPNGALWRITWDNREYVCRYEDNLTVDPKTGEQVGIFSQNGEESVLVYRIPQADKDFYAPAEIERRNREADEALEYLEQSATQLKTGHELAETCEPGDVVTFVEPHYNWEVLEVIDQGEIEGVYQGLNEFGLGIEVLVNGKIRSVFWDNICRVSHQTPDPDQFTTQEQEKTTMTHIQALVTKYKTYRTASRTSTEQYGYTEVLLALTRENPVADLEQRIAYLNAQPENTGVLVKLEIFEGALASLKQSPQSTTIEQADALVETLGMVEQVEEHEHNEHGHVYTLANGGSLVVTGPTRYHFALDDDQLVTLPLGDL